MDSMRDILKQQLGRSLRSMPDLDRLAAAWPVACGRAMAERGQVVGFTDGVIQVAVSDATWLKQMISMHGTLERELSRIAGVKSAGIHFELKK